MTKYSFYKSRLRVTRIAPILSAAVILIVFGCFSGAITQTLQPYVVKGRVVDADNRGVANARVYLEPDWSKSTSWERMMIEIVSDEGGYFSFSRKEVNLKSEPFRFLYTLYIPDDNTAKQITVPFDSLQKLDKRFRGQKIAVKPNGVIDLGDIAVQVYYSTLNVDLSKLRVCSAKGTIDWDNFELRIRHVSGKRVSESGLSEFGLQHYVDYDRSLYKVSVPEGKWIFEALFDDRVLGRTSAIEIKSGALPQVVSVSNTCSRAKTGK